MKYFILLTFILSFFEAGAHTLDSAFFGDSGIKGPTYREFTAKLYQLENSYQRFVKIMKYGHSIEKRPLLAIKITSPVAPTAGKRQAIVITGNIHGNEYLNIEDRLPLWFLQEAQKSSQVSRFLNQGGIIYVIPIVNPDGYANRERENAIGADLNRDLPVEAMNHYGPLETETQALVHFFQTQFSRKPIQMKLSVDYHCCASALIRSWGLGSLPMPPERLMNYNRVGHLFLELFPSYRYGDTISIMNYFAIGTLNDWLFDQYGSVAFAYEGEEKTESGNFTKHTMFWDEVLSLINVGHL